MGLNPKPATKILALARSPSSGIITSITDHPPPLAGVNVTVIVQVFPGVVIAGQSVLVSRKAPGLGPLRDMFLVSSLV